MATRRITKRAAARRDLVEHYVYLAENASESVAERFLSSAEASFQELLRQPLIGAPLPLTHPMLAGMRKWRIRDFDRLLIFFCVAWTACPSFGYFTARKIGGPHYQKHHDCAQHALGQRRLVLAVAPSPLPPQNGLSSFL